MKRIITLIAFLIIADFSSAQDREEYFVINPLGATILSEPDFNSQRIGRINPGEKILIIDPDFSKESTLSIGPHLEINGHWISIHLSDETGFIFTTDLSKFPPSRLTEYEGQEELHLSGKQLKREEYSEEQATEFGTFPKRIKKIQFEKASVEEVFFDGCLTWEYELKGFSLSEAYHQVLQLTASIWDNRIEIPKVISQEQNTWNFSNIDACQEIKLVDLGKGNYRISFYSCT